MKIIVLIGFLSIFTTFVNSNVIQRITDDEDDDTARIEKEDIEMFKGKGLWFYDDNGNLVQATLNKTLFSNFRTELKINLEDIVFFKLYTRKFTKGYQSLYLNDEFTLSKSHFDPKKPTKFITHGWINSYKSPACTLIRDAYLRDGDFNVIVVDWSKISLGEYILASKQVKKIGRYVGSMIDFLETKGMDLSRTTLVGHSLGAHIMGLAGYFAKRTVNYIVGLDPALPLFKLAKKGSRISADDASYVEIIHTNAGLLGFKNEIGDADFYPNGGESQLGCMFDITGACSHFRSYEFYAESILSDKGFYGKKCDDYDSYVKGNCDGELALMGGEKHTLRSTGKFFLKTREIAPFAVGPEL